MDLNHLVAWLVIIHPGLSPKSANHRPLRRSPSFVFFAVVIDGIDCLVTDEGALLWSVELLNPHAVRAFCQFGAFTSSSCFGGDPCRCPCHVIITMHHSSLCACCGGSCQKQPAAGTHDGHPPQEAAPCTSPMFLCKYRHPLSLNPSLSPPPGLSGRARGWGSLNVWPASRPSV